MEKKQSDSHNRRVVGYLRPSIAPKFEKYVQNKGISNSDAINEAVKLMLEQNSYPGDQIRKSRNSY